MTVGERMKALFEGTPAEPAGPASVEPEPTLAPEVGERIRSLLREGDWQSAASYAEKVLDSVGIDERDASGRRDRASPELQEHET
jgi:hypothetical protein